MDSAKCKSCVYRSYDWKRDIHCQYILVEGKMRKCEGGDVCKKYKPGKPIRLKEFAEYTSYKEGRLKDVLDNID